MVAVAALAADDTLRMMSDHEQTRIFQEEFRFIRCLLLEINHNILLLLNRAQSATLRLKPNIVFKARSQGWTVWGEKHMPATILIGGTASSLFQEWTGPNGTGTVVPDAGPIAYASDNPGVATVDPASGLVTGVSAGTANITGTDSADNLVGTDVITVNAPPPPPPVSATLTLTANQ